MRHILTAGLLLLAVAALGCGDNGGSRDTHESAPATKEKPASVEKPQTMIECLKELEDGDAQASVTRIDKLDVDPTSVNSVHLAWVIDSLNGQTGIANIHLAPTAKKAAAIAEDEATVSTRIVRRSGLRVVSFNDEDTDFERDVMHCVRLPEVGDYAGLEE